MKMTLQHMEYEIEPEWEFVDYPIEEEEDGLLNQR